jgi:hypothetical protein
MKASHPVMINGKRVGKLRASSLLFKETWKYLRADKELMWIPLIGGLLSVVLFGLLVSLFVLGGAGAPFFEDSASLTVFDWAFIFGCYIVCAFAAAITQAGISHTVYVRSHGGNASLGQALKTAFSHWPSLLVWSAITSTVGVLLRMLVERSNVLGQILAALLGTAWSVLTYFVVPAMVIDKKTAFASLSKSAAVFKGTWGETIVSNISLSLAFLIVHVLVFLAVLGLALAFPEPVLALTVISVYLVWLVLALLVQSTMEAILKTLLYIYASESSLPTNFNSELLGQMLVRSNTFKASAVPTQIPPLA